jgi:streptogramin lyase
VACFCGAGCAQDDAIWRRPRDLRVAPDGTLFVSDVVGNRVLHLDADGALLQVIGARGVGKGELWRPFGLVPMPDGGVTVVNHRPLDVEHPNEPWRELKRFDARGREVGSWPLRIPGEDAFGWPDGVDRIPDGLVVADADAEALLFLDERGAVVRSLAAVVGGPPVASVQRPRYRDGRLCFAEYAEHRVRCVDDAGQQVLSLDRAGHERGELWFPLVVDIGPDGRLAVADHGNYRVQVFSAQGELLDVIAPEPSAPDVQPQVFDVSFDAAGALWILDSKGARILVWDGPGAALREVVAHR